MGWLDPDFFVYSDETDFCKRLHDAGWRILFVPAARAVHHDQLSTDPAAHGAADRRVPPRPRPLLPQAPHARHPAAWTRCWTWAYLVPAPRWRCALPGRDPRRYLLHARQQLTPRPRRGAARGRRGVQRLPPASRAAAPLRCPRRWSTRTSPKSQRSAARSDRRSCCSPASALALLGGLVLLGAGRGRARRRRSGDGDLDKLSSAAGGAAAAVLGARGARRAAAALLVRRPALVPLAVLVAAPFRPPLDFSGSNRFFVAIAEDGRLGRLLPLYFVLAAAGAGARLADAPRCGACASAAARARAARRRRSSALPSSRCCGRTTSRPGANCSCSSRCRSRCCSAAVARAEFPDWMPRVLAIVAHRAGVAVRRRRPLPGDHARAVLLRAQPRGLERQHGLLPRHVAVRRPEPLRPPRGPRASAIVLALLATGRGRDLTLLAALVLHVGRPVLLLLAVEHDRAAARDARARGATGDAAGAAGGGGRWRWWRRGGARLRRGRS